MKHRRLRLLFLGMTVSEDWKIDCVYGSWLLERGKFETLFPSRDLFRLAFLGGPYHDSPPPHL